MGHSGGTYLGIKLVEAYPDAFEAYIGVAQMSRQRLSEKLAYDYIKTEYEGRRDRRRVYEALASEPVTSLFVPSLLFSKFTVAEKVGLWRAKATSGVSALWREMMEEDLADGSRRFEVPVYFLHGEHDYTCSYALAREYYESIEAPDKACVRIHRGAYHPGGALRLPSS